MKQLTRFERWIEQLVEEPFVRLFAGRLLPQDVVQYLVRALEDGESTGADGTPEVPGRYRVDLNPADLNVLLRHHPDLQSQLADALHSLADHLDIRLREPSAVQLYANPQLSPHDVRITPLNGKLRPMEGTRELSQGRIQQVEHLQRGILPGAYLIIKGDRTFDLTQPVVSIGRALDNDLILEEQQVSRYHAELRERYGRYIVQDLGSRVGTAVNGFQVQETVLRPGDLISIGGVDLIYAETDLIQQELTNEVQWQAGDRSKPGAHNAPHGRGGTLSFPPVKE